MEKNIHIWDLPINKVYIKLEDKFRKNFFSLIHKKFKSWNKAGKFFGIKRADTTLAINWKRGDVCCPLSKILEIANFLKISKKVIEKNIIEIKCKTQLNNRGGSSGKPIKNPKLPIKIDENLVEILGHICGDGTITRVQPHKGINFNYINSEPTLIKEFQNLMKQVFGDITPNILVRDKKPHYRRPNYVLQYPTIISLFVLSIFDYKTKENMTLPKFIFKMSKKAKCRFLRAIFDDEGTINDKSIVLGMKPQHIIQGIKNLLEDIGIKTPKIRKLNRGMHSIEIRKGEYVKKFEELIGFKHPRKAKILGNIINIGWKFERYDNYEAPTKIINFLKNNNKSSIKDLSLHLNRGECNIREHMRNLKNKGLVNYNIKKQNNYPHLLREWFLVGDNFEQKERK